MVISYTDNLGLPIVPADYTENWDVPYNLMMEKLDRNPGIRIVANESEMAALNAFGGRKCWREDVKRYWSYDGEQWSEDPGQQEQEGVSAGGGMQSTIQHITSSIAAGTTGTGFIPFNFFPGTGEEIMLLMLRVLPWGNPISVDDEPVQLVGEIETLLQHAMITEIEVENLIVKKNDLDKTPYIRGIDYNVVVSAAGTAIARINGGGIADSETVLVDYDYRPGVTGFRLRLVSKEVSGEILYELDTSRDPNWEAGSEVRDPNFGYLPVCYYKNEDQEPYLQYQITNYDVTLASQFIIDCKYKPLT